MKKENKLNILLFTRKYDDYKSGVFNYALKMLGNSEDAEDVTQNVFIKLFHNLDKIRDKSKIKIWVYKTARNEIYGIYRKSNNYQIPIDEAIASDFVDDTENQPHTKIEAEEIGNLIQAEVEKLSEINRDTFLLREYSGLTYNEIADVTGVDVNVVKSRLFKTRKKLMKKISKYI